VSAYSFGKIVTDESRGVTERIIRLASDSRVKVTFGFHELDDEDILDESELLRGEGVVFNLFTPGDTDIVTLCNEVLEAGSGAIRRLLGEDHVPYSWEQARSLALPEPIYAAMLATRLGRFVDGLFRIQDTQSGGFAIFENGVQQLIEDTATNCRSLILRSLLLPWDVGPNALFIWKATMAVVPLQ
jgi:hypothetical protein